MLGKYTMYGLVRGKDGKPKVDNPDHLHPMQLGMMTAEEREGMGIWQGSWVRDADGYKPVSIKKAQVFAEQNLIAVSELFLLPDDGSGATMIAIKPRCDVKAGAPIPGVSTD